MDFFLPALYSIEIVLSSLFVFFFQQPTDTLAVTYANLASEVIASADSSDVHPSVFEVPKLPDQLDLEDCLKAFSETEVNRE